MSSEAKDLRVTTEETGPVERQLRVEVDASRVARAFDRAYRDLGGRVRVRGFRPGKIPRSVLEKLYGAAVREDIERALVAETLPEVLAEAGVEPVSEPSIETETPEPGGPFRYGARIEVKPVIELPDLAGLSGKRPPVEVSDTDVLRELESLRERRGELVDEPEGSAAGEGHFLTIDYVGSIEGALFEGGSAEGAVIELGSSRFIPGFEAGLEGAAAGEHRTLEVDFPADYGAPEVAGKHARFEVDVTAVRRRQLPELDDAFAKEVGDFEDLDALRARVRADLTTQRENGARGELRSSLLGWILERTEFEVPQGLVERRLGQRLSSAHQQLAQVLPEEELHGRLAEWREEWRPAAERDVREELVLDAVVAEQGLGAEESEIEQRLDELAQERGMAPARLRKSFDERGMLPALRAEIGYEKAVDWLASRAKVEEASGS